MPATQVFPDAELERLRRFPEISRDELFRFFTLTIPASADVELVSDPPRDPSRMSEATRLQLEMLGPGDAESV